MTSPLNWCFFSSVANSLLNLFSIVKILTLMTDDDERSGLETITSNSFEKWKEGL